MIQNKHLINHPGQGTTIPHHGRYAGRRFDAPASGPIISMRDISQRAPRKLIVGAILMVALLAFEVFNFDTTRYALRDLLGGITFMRIEWAAILAIAFCSIDFAGLIRLFTIDRGQEMPKEVWYLMGAWLLGATMNAMMTWWAITLTLLNHDFGNEVLNREQLLYIVPIFVAVLVWLTRILFIGAFTVAGDQILDLDKEEADARNQPGPYRAIGQPARPYNQGQSLASFTSVTDDVPNFLKNRTAAPVPKQRKMDPAPPPPPSSAPISNSDNNGNGAMPRSQPQRENSNGRVRQRPPVPNPTGRMATNGIQARGRGR